MPNTAGILCNTPIHNDVELGTTTTKVYVNQGIYYANEGEVATNSIPPPLVWANRIGATQNYRSVMAFCRTGVFVTGVSAVEDFWPQFYRPHYSNRQV
jgi:hypothetical protein